MRAKHGARQQREGRPFKTRGWIVTDEPLAAHLAFCNRGRVCVHIYECTTNQRQCSNKDSFEIVTCVFKSLVRVLYQERRIQKKQILD